MKNAMKKKCLQIGLECRLFQALGPATANARSPRIVRVPGTYNWPTSADRSQREHLDEGG